MSRFVWALLLAASMVPCSVDPCSAAPAGPLVAAWPEGEPSPDEASPAEANPEPGLVFQESEEPVRKLKPSKPREAADEVRLDALGWYAAARLMQARNDLPGALRAYGKAIDSDPTAAEVYESALPVALTLQQFDLVVKWSLKASRLDPANLQFLQQIAVRLRQKNDLDGAIQLLEQVAKSPAIAHDTQDYVFLMGELASLYAAPEVDRVDDAAGALEVVFDALEQPEKYKLAPRDVQRLQADSASNYERMGQIFLKAKKTERALAALEKAVAAKKGGAGNLSFYLAQAQLQAGRAEQALEEIRKYIDSERQVHGRAAYELLSQILEKLGRSQELVPILKTAAETDSRNSTLQFYLAEQLAQSGRLDEAETLFQSTLEFAAEPEGYVGLAGVYRRQRRPAELIASLGKSYAEAGDLKGLAVEFKTIIGDEALLDNLLETALKKAEVKPPQLDFAAGYVMANLAADGKRSAIAEKLYRFVLSFRPERAGLIMQELGGHYIEVHKYAEAARVFEEAADDARLTENRPTFLYFLSQARELAGDTKGALEAIGTAQQAVGDNPLLLSQEAWIYYHSQQYPEAITRYQKVLSDYPGLRSDLIRRAQSVLSNIYVLTGDAPKGIEILEAIYRENPREVGINNDLGYLYADQNIKLEQAHEMIKRAVEAEPENAAYLDSMGWVLFRLGRFDEAVPYLEKAIKISTSSGDETLYDHLGDAYERLDKPEQALAAYQKSLELARQAAYPDRKLLERVEQKVKRIEEIIKNKGADTGRLKPARAGNP